MRVLIVGSGIAGLSAAIRSAELGCDVMMVSPYVSERAQSVMAAGGINAALDNMGEDDSNEFHIQDTLKGGVWLEDESAVRGLCEAAPDVVRWLDSIGVMFSRTKSGDIAQRAFGGQSKRRTAYAGASTGKQIVTALTQKCREHEISGSVERRCGLSFHSALITDGICYGAVFTDDVTGEVVDICADAVIMATGGMNKLFGKTTGSELCDGYAAGRLLTQGVVMRNLEFIQYHPTTIETANKRMLITEAVRGEGGRLYYEEDGKRIYFMEDMFGERGNLMPRDVVSRCIYNCPSQVYLDVSFLGSKLISERLAEAAELCEKYLDIDITKESIPVAPSVHFFMGGICVDDRHRTNIHGLYAAGECASKYHGANRLGGNSLLAAVYSGRVAAEAGKDDHAARMAEKRKNDQEGRMEEMRSSEQAGVELTYHDADRVSDMVDRVRRELSGWKLASHDLAGQVSATALKKRLAEIMNRDLGIVRDAEGLQHGIKAVDACLSDAANLRFRSDVLLYDNYSIYHMLIMAKAILMSALARKESRGAHYRSDFPETDEAFRRCTIAVPSDGRIDIRLEDANSSDGDGASDECQKDSGESSRMKDGVEG